MKDETWRRHANPWSVWTRFAAIGATLLTLGLATLSVWPTTFGATLVVVTQLWRIDRFATLYDAKNV